jgi:hypothetical protein
MSCFGPYRFSKPDTLPNKLCVEEFAWTANLFDCESRRDSPTGILTESESTQRELNPRLRHGKAVRFRYIMGTFFLPLAY